jgi:V-type H+-transporting ATPase subunit G
VKVTVIATMVLIYFHSFQQYEGSQTNTQSAVDKDTQVKVKAIDEAFEKNNKNVVEKLLERVTQTTAELHRNLQKV